MKGMNRNRLAMLSVVGLLAAPPAFAANQLTNPNFAADLTGWGGSPFPFSWVSTEGYTALGAAKVDVLSPGGNFGSIAFGQCTTAIAGGTYDFGGAFKSDPASTQAGSGAIRVVWYSGAGCSAGTSIGDRVDATGVSGWQLLQFNNTVAPAGTQSARVEALQGANDTGTFSAFWDDFYFGPDPTPVELQVFTIE